jgi:hypothetical protein
MNSYSVKSSFIAVLFVALLLLSFASLLAAQDATPEPPTVEMPTLEPPTPEPPTLEPPTATFTELPSLTATFTETPSPTLTLTETETLTATLTPSATETPFATTTLTPSSTTTLLPTPTITVTPGRPDYAAELREWRENRASLPQAQSLSSTCATDVNLQFSIVAPPASGNPPADLYAAIAQAHAPGAASPYPIYLCAGTFPMNDGRAFFVDVNFYGRGIDVSVIQRLPTNINNGLFFVHDSAAVEFHHVTIVDGYSTGEGGTIRIWSGTARVFDSKIDSSEANGGGAIDGDRAELARVALTNNTSTGYGGGVRLFTMTAECVRFGNNSAQGYGGAVFMVLDAIVRNSSFTGNSAALLQGNQLYGQYRNVDAQQNWWAVSPVVPDEVTSTVDTSNPLSSDPTSHYATGDYYNPASPCQMTDPIPLPTGTCEITDASAPFKLRIQPALYDENWLFEVPASYLYSQDTEITSGAALPDRDWLWQGGMTPGTIIISRIQAIARVGAIGWVDPDVDWIQVEVVTGSGTVTGYIERTNISGATVTSLFNCSLGNLPAPTPDPGLPVVSLDAFAGVSPIVPLFDGLQSPATMGTFGLHIGTNPTQLGATLDIVPRNMELCIDTTATNQLVLCNTLAEPPVYSPVNGCAINTGTPDSTVEINIDLYIRDSSCTSGQASGDLQVVITHIDIDSSIVTTNRIPVLAGDLLGRLCGSTTAQSVCGVATSITPTHVAFQLRTLSFSGPSIQEINDVIPFLGVPVPNCAYDEWAYSPNNPTVQSNPFHGCTQ